MKRPYTVWLEPDEEDWVRQFSGADFRRQHGFAQLQLQLEVEPVQ